MPSFENLFLKSKGKPVVYHGRTLQMADSLNIADGKEFKVIFESANADWREGVCLTTDGGFIVNNQMVKKSVVLWHDTAPKEILLKIQTKKNQCHVKNVWDTGDGVMHSWHNGAAMIVEEISFGKHYLCNDGRPDDDFDDLIFRIEWSKVSTNSEHHASH